MDTRFLESFVTVADSGSLAEAARRLNLTPAAVVQRIRALETELGAELLRRSGRTLRPTEAGSAILAKSRSFLKDVRDLKVLATGTDAVGELRLGAISTALTGMLPGMLSKLSAPYPRLEIYVVPGTSKNLYADVCNGEIDAALIVEPPFGLPKTCHWHLLREERLVLLAPAATKERDPATILRREQFIRYDRSHWGGRLGDLYLRQMEIAPRERLELDALDAIAVLVDCGLGVSLVPDWAPPWPQGLSLAKIPLPEPNFVRRIGLVWLRSSPRSRLVDAFLEQAGPVQQSWREAQELADAG